MADHDRQWDEKRPAVEHPDADQEDMLSPSRALRESLGSSHGQRVGDSGPLANPEISFPEELDDAPEC